MKNIFQKIKYITIPSLIVAGMFVFSLPTQAAVAEQTVFDTLSDRYVGTDGASNFNNGCQVLGTGLSSGLSDDPSAFGLSLKVRAIDTWTGFLGIRVLQSDTALTDCSETRTNGEDLIFQVPSQTWTAGQDYDINITALAFSGTDWQFQPSKYYVIGRTDGDGAWGSSNANTRLKVYGSATDEYANGFWTVAEYAPATDANINDAYFVLTAPNSDGSFGSFVTPSEGQIFTSHTEARHWGGTCGGTDRLRVRVRNDEYGNDNELISSFFSCNLGGVWEEIFDFSLGNSATWHSLLEDENGRFLDTVNFEVDISNNSIADSTFGTSVVVEPIDPDNENSPFFVDCTDYAGVNFFNDGVFDGIFCYTKKTIFGIVGVLFDVPAGVQNTLDNSFVNIKNSFPFSVFFDITEIIEDKLDDTVTGSTLSITFPPPLDHTFDILTPTLLEDVVGTDFKDLVFESIMTIIWIIVGFIILHKIF